MKTSHGGKREGAGKPKGMKWASTLEKEAGREFVRQYVTGRLEPLLSACFDNAVGLRHLMMRDPHTGRCERVTGSPEQIDEALKSDNALWIYTKEPSVQAFTELLNRALDKPAEHDGGSRCRAIDHPLAIR